MKHHENTVVFKYPWEQVAKALWQRYPNPKSAHVLSEDTVDRKVVGNCLHSKRFLIKTNVLPKWGEKITGIRVARILEESVVNPEKKEICTYSRNVESSSTMGVVERVTYRPSSENEQWTVVERHAWVDSKLFGIGYALRKFGIERYKRNIKNTTIGFLYVLNRLFPDTESFAFADLAENHRMTLEERRQRLKDAAKETAKRAKELAQGKAGPIYASCEGAKS